MPAHHPDHGGLSAVLDTLMQRQAERRRALRWLGAGTASALVPMALSGCGGGGSDSAGSTSLASSSTSGGASTTTTTTTGSCSVIPTETAGPYPADGTSASGQRLNALALSGIVRSDIRSSVATASGTAAGVPLTVVLQLANTNGSCAGLAGRAVYLWHCTREGSYSMYGSGITAENYLRGVQVSDANGQVSFTTIFPGCYSGRWPHIHFEVYASLAAATDAGTVGDEIAVSQLALPAAACKQVYGVASGYGASVANLAATSLASDNVFGNDSAATQLPVVTGNASDGFVATLTVGIAA
jgi:protocatechuate 3,4-dioxygenase beta subunit